MPRAERPQNLFFDALFRLDAGDKDGVSNAILAQEARGQAELVANAELPTDSDPPLQEAAAAIGGLVIGEASKDRMFTVAKLPDGWRKDRTDHSMWSKLLDDKGRERAMIFYKAAIYDRSAHMSWSSRYRVDNGYGDNGVVGVEDRSLPGQYLFMAGKVDAPNEPYSKERHAAREAMAKQCSDWLDEHLPEWRSPFAYWD